MFLYDYIKVCELYSVKLLFLCISLACECGMLISAAFSGRLGGTRSGIYDAFYCLLCDKLHNCAKNDII